MYKQTQILFKKVITPAHVGSGNDLGIIDLPIQREKHTGFPKIEGSSLKGSMREAFESNSKLVPLDIHLAFGYDEDSDKGKKTSKDLNEKTQFAGALGFSDSRLLLFPVKSAKGVFAYATCPLILKRFNEEVKLTESVKDADLTVPVVNQGEALIFKGSKVCKGPDGRESVTLEEYTFSAKIVESVDPSSLFQKAGELFGDKVTERLVVLNDDDFSYFADNATEVITRTKIDNESGTVKDGALFNEEYLPAETYLYSLVFSGPVFNDNKGSFEAGSQAVFEWFEKNKPAYLQIGANATIGKGICKLALYGGK